MSLPWKILLALAVVLPLGGFVAGSLASTATDEPPARQPIVISDPTTSPPRPERTRPAETPRPGERDDDDQDDQDDHDDDVEVITPQPYEDDGDDRRDGGDDEDGGDDGGD